MRRTLIGTFIAVYLTALTGGVLSQVLRYGMAAHPVMYFFVWDMYCGWSAYNARFRAVAEGVSGQCYDLNPPPWGTFRPFNTQDRMQYSTGINWMAKSAAHTVVHTEHEPIARIYVLEQAWAKKFDLPDYVWKTRYDMPKQKYTYSTVRVEMDGLGTVTKSYPNWVEIQRQSMLADNPRLQQTIRNSRSFWMVDDRQSEGEGRYFRDDQPSAQNVTTLSPSAN